MDERAAEIVAWSIAWEGCFHIRVVNKRKDSHSYGGIIDVANTNPIILHKLQELADGIGTITVRDNKKYPHMKPTYHWRLGSHKDCLSMASQVLPYLPIKQEQAAIMVEICSRAILLDRAHQRGTVSERDRLLYERCKELNKRGLNAES